RLAEDRALLFVGEFLRRDVEREILSEGHGRQAGRTGVVGNELRQVGLFLEVERSDRPLQGALAARLQSNFLSEELAETGIAQAPRNRYSERGLRQECDVLVRKPIHFHPAAG